MELHMDDGTFILAYLTQDDYRVWDPGRCLPIPIGKSIPIYASVKAVIPGDLLLT